MVFALNIDRYGFLNLNADYNKFVTNHLSYETTMVLKTCAAVDWHFSYKTLKVYE